MPQIPLPLDMITVLIFSYAYFLHSLSHLIHYEFILLYTLHHKYFLHVTEFQEVMVV